MPSWVAAVESFEAIGMASRGNMERPALSALAPNLTARAAGLVRPTRPRGLRARPWHDGGEADGGGGREQIGCGGFGGGGSRAARRRFDRSAPPRRSS